MTPHLRQPGQSSRKGKSLLVSREQTALFQHTHAHAEIVHEIAHDVVDVVAFTFVGVGLGLRRVGGDFLVFGRGAAGVLCDFAVDRLQGLVEFAAGQEELREGHGGGQDELGLGFVDGVDEGDEAAGPVAFSVRHPGHVGHDEGVERPHHLDVVGGAGGAANQFIEGEAGGSAGDEGDLNIAAPDGDGGGMGWVGFRIAEEGEPFVGVADGGAIERVVVDAGRGSRKFSIVGGRVEVDDSELFLEEVDAGNEGLTLDAVFIQVVRMPVGRGDEDHTVGHEGFEQTAEDHGIGDIGTLEFVEAEDLGGFGNVGGDKRDGVELAPVLHADLV